MTSLEIRTADKVTLKAIIAGLVRGNSDRTSMGIAYAELESRGIIKARF